MTSTASALTLTFLGFLLSACPDDGDTRVGDVAPDTSPDTVEVSDGDGPSDTLDSVETPDTTDTPDTPDTNDTSDTLDTNDTSDTHDTTDTSDTVTPPTGLMRVHVLDVGQGEAILVEFPCGAMLIDTGGEVTPASPSAPAFDSVERLDSQLRAFFAARPDLDQTLTLLVLTHPHIDHTRGVDRLLEMVEDGELTISHIVTNGAEGSGSGVLQQRKLHDFADTHGIPRWYVLERKAREGGGLSNDIIDPFPACSRDPDVPAAELIDPVITALWGRIDDASTLASTWREDDLDNGNNHSVVLRVAFGGASALFPGDLESAGIGELIRTFWSTGLLDVDLYKAGHHGSYNGTTAALVNAMSPELAVISAGPPHRTGDWTAWSYGLPRWAAISDMLGDNDSDGVALLRSPAITVPIGTSWNGEHGVFTDKRIPGAVYSTGWDGALSITLYPDGAIALPTLARPAIARPGR